jgi:hypothetical protein
MLWQISIAPQRLTPRGGSSIPFAGRPVDLSETSQHLGRWRD